jgi:DNA/RNA-binding domain of Phe-tRNA-synthetase-like protein|nr:hypothetical protein [Kofleriaceae bacterium]
MSVAVTVRPHPLLEVGAFVTRLSRALGDCVLPVDAVATPPASAGGGSTDDAVKTAVRELLRAGGFKPAGRSKPASEYLVAAHAEGRFPAINALVDACNWASLYGGLPISLIDLDLMTPGPIAVDCAPAGTSYVFNPSGQTIDAGHLLCVLDGSGPTGTPVKDAQRTKTHAGTRATLSIVWGTSALAGRTAAVTAWYRAVVARIDGAVLEDVAVRSAP